MSSTPPAFGPFGSPSGSPGRIAPDKQSRKAQKRAAQQQAQWQRESARAQRRALQRRSAVGPLLVVSLGIALLLIQTGSLRWKMALLWLGRWWPALLIFAGVVLVVEWAIDRQSLHANPAAIFPVRTLSGGTTLLLVLCSVLGVSVATAENSSLWLKGTLADNLRRTGLGDWREIFGPQSEFTENLSAALDQPGRLTIEIPRGDLTVTGSSTDGQVHVTAHQRIYAWASSDAEERRRAEKVHFTGLSAELTLVAPADEQDTADLEVQVPHDATLTIHSAHGDVTVEELREGVTIAADGGDVHLTALRGPVHLAVQNDDASVTAHSLGNGLTVMGRTGDLNLSDVQGPLTVRGDFFGTTHIERVKGEVHFESSFTNFACAGIPGSLNVEGRTDLDADKLLGPLVISTTNRTLLLQHVQGAVTVADRNGSVILGLEGSAQPVQINNENGSVELSLPKGHGYALQAVTRNGEIENDFGLLPTKAGAGAQMTGHIISGGPLLRLQTTEGDIRVRKSTEAGNHDDSDEESD